MKKYILYAGVNGAGKSTLYNTTYYGCEKMLRINTDEIVRELGDWKNTADLMKAGKIAVEKLKQYMEDGVTFNQETTLCGHSIYNAIVKAKKRGYFIEMHYVGVDSAEIAVERVAKRVEEGGHDVPRVDVERRYIESMKNLVCIIPLCDLVALYDNTKKFRRFAIYKKGELVLVSNETPSWYSNISSYMKR
jgi:predicted ABC-type ATPase